MKAGVIGLLGGFACALLLLSAPVTAQSPLEFTVGIAFDETTRGDELQVIDGVFDQASSVSSLVFVADVERYRGSGELGTAIEALNSRHVDAIIIIGHTSPPFTTFGIPMVGGADFGPERHDRQFRGDYVRLTAPWAVSGRLIGGYLAQRDIDSIAVISPGPRAGAELAAAFLSSGSEDRRVTTIVDLFDVGQLDESGYTSDQLHQALDAHTDLIVCLCVGIIDDVVAAAPERFESTDVLVSTLSPLSPAAVGETSEYPYATVFPIGPAVGTLFEMSGGDATIEEAIAIDAASLIVLAALTTDGDMFEGMREVSHGGTRCVFADCLAMLNDDIDLVGVSGSLDLGGAGEPYLGGVVVSAADGSPLGSWIDDVVDPHLDDVDWSFSDTGTTGVAAITAVNNGYLTVGRGERRDDIGLASSPDGVSWDPIEIPELSGYSLGRFTAVAYSGDLTVAVGFSTRPDPDEEEDKEIGLILTSVDGNAWDLTETELEPSALYRSDGWFFMATVGDDAGIYRSQDAEEWEQVASLEEGTDDAVRGIVRGAHGYVAFGDRSVTHRVVPAAWFSEDGSSWERTFSGELQLRSYTNGFDVAAGGPGYVAVGSAQYGHGRVWVSDDGREWTPVEASVLHDVQVKSITNASGLLVAVGQSFRADGTEIVIATSRNGEDWARLPYDPVHAYNTYHITVTDVIVAPNGRLIVSAEGWDGPTRRRLGLTWTADIGFRGDELPASTTSTVPVTFASDDSLEEDPVAASVDPPADDGEPIPWGLYIALVLGGMVVLGAALFLWQKIDPSP